MSLASTSQRKKTEQCTHCTMVVKNIDQKVDIWTDNVKCMGPEGFHFILLPPALWLAWDWIDIIRVLRNFMNHLEFEYELLRFMFIETLTLFKKCSNNGHNQFSIIHLKFSKYFCAIQTAIQHLTLHSQLSEN